jgi:signal transduction histidine kinase
VRIRVRLLLYAVAVATAGMVLFGVLLTALARGGVGDDQDTALERLAGSLAAAIDEAGPDLLAGREPLVAPDPRVDDDAFLLVTDPLGATVWSGALLDGTPIRVPAAVLVEAAETGRSVATTRPAEGLELRVVAVPWAFGDGYGAVVAAQPLRALQAQLDGLASILWVAGLVTVIAVAIVTWLVVGRALRPLRALSATADAIATTGDLGRRLPPVRGGDEVATLTRSFNGMLDRLGATQAELAAALAAQRRFVADASHELRTPLTTIRTNAETLRAHPDADPGERVAAVADIADEAERMSRLVDDLLLLARADAGGGAAPALRPVDLAAIAGEVARKATRPGRPVRSATSGPAVVSGDPDALTRLAWILVDNALRHGAGETVVATAAEGTAIRLWVTDEGPGFAPGDETRAFERFWRADRARSGPGAGLGLAIARSIVDAHGGTIAAATRPEGGAVVEVRLSAMGAGGTARTEGT